jgi:hypothetical protein
MSRLGRTCESCTMYVGICKMPFLVSVTLAYKSVLCECDFSLAYQWETIAAEIRPHICQDRAGHGRVPVAFCSRVLIHQ